MGFKENREFSGDLQHPGLISTFSSDSKCYLGDEFRPKLWLTSASEKALQNFEKTVLNSVPVEEITKYEPGDYVLFFCDSKYIFLG